MKTGVNVVRATVGVTIIAGLCLTQGCSTISGWFGGGADETAKPSEKSISKEQRPPPPPPPVVRIAPTEPPRLVERPTLKPVAPVTTPYTVKAGESVSDVAHKYRLRWQDVLAANPELSLKSHLRTGQVVHLPGQVDLSKARAVPKKVAPKKKHVVTPPPAAVPGATEPGVAAPATGEATYTVQSGDSIHTIAAKHHVKRTDLMKANSLTAAAKLKIGQKLVIPAATAATPAGTPAGIIAPPTPVPDTGTGVPPPAAPGVIVAPGAPPAPAATEAKTQTYTVKEGEDLYAVAIRWGVSPTELKAINNLTSAELTPGTVLKIPVVQTTP